jgi:hypothetical protein
MKLAISGWRGMTSKEHLLIFQQAMEDLLVTQNRIPTLIITGGARGADAMGEEWARAHRIPLLVLKPDYERFGKRAPLLRNTDIVKECTHLLAFPHSSGSGTQDAIRKAFKLDKTVSVYHL